MYQHSAITPTTIGLLRHRRLKCTRNTVPAGEVDAPAMLPDVGERRNDGSDERSQLDVVFLLNTSMAR